MANSNGVSVSSANHDQYSDGRAAKVWELYMGNKSSRTEAYKQWFINAFKEEGVKRVIDLACGTGIDSVMLLEEGFDVVSSDGSDKMLKVALEERWRRRKESAFDNWVIREANWLTIAEDANQDKEMGRDFDAVICCGNSFAHLPDFDGTQAAHRLAIQNFYEMLKPGGLLFIDHRNYDAIIDKGKAPSGPNVYYQGKFIKDITCSNLFVNGKPAKTTLNYLMDIQKVEPHILDRLKIDPEEQVAWKFQLSYYPHRLKDFSALLKGLFGENAKHRVFADFKPLDEGPECPAYYMHIIKKPL